MKLLNQELWTLYRNGPSNGFKDEVVYVMGPTAKEVWDSVIEQEALGTGHTKKSLMAKGYRARRIGVIVV